MEVIDLQNKATAEKGTVEAYWFKNEEIDLKRTLFHRMTIPLKPFDTGLKSEPQPVKTEIAIEWLNLNLRDPLELDGLVLRSSPRDDSDISIYIGGAHNPCDIRRMAINKIERNLYEIDCVLLVDFEHQGVAKNETFQFKTQVELDPQIEK